MNDGADGRKGRPAHRSLYVLFLRDSVPGYLVQVKFLSVATVGIGLRSKKCYAINSTSNENS